MHTMILMPMLREARGLIGRLGLEADGSRTGTGLPSFAGDDIRLRLIGIGASPEDVDRALTVDLPAGRSMRVLLGGFAGALEPSLVVGQVIIADRVIDAGGQAVTLQAWPTDGQPTDSLGRGMLLSGPQPLSDASAKRQACRQFGAQAVDMESAVVARVCAERGLRLCIVRAISDSADQSLPPGLMDLADRWGRARPGAVARYLLTGPHRLPMLARLAGQQQRAADALTEAVVKLLGGD